MNAIWPHYRAWMALAIFVLFLGASVAVGLSLWWLLVTVLLVALIVGWLLAIVSWLGRNLNQPAAVVEAIDTLLAQSAATPLIYISTGIRETAAQLYKRYPHPPDNELIVIDVYRPQLMRSQRLARLRHESEINIRPSREQAIDWLAGRIDLLPVTNESAPIVIVDQVFSALDDYENRSILLEELHRILEPGGQLILIEKAQTPANGWTLGLAGLNRWETRTYWRELLLAHDHNVVEVAPINGLLFAAQAHKTAHIRPRQMAFTFPAAAQRRR